MKNPSRLVFAFLSSSVVFALCAPDAHASETVAAPKMTLLDLALDGNRFVTGAMSGMAPSGREAASDTSMNATPAEPPPLVDLLPRASIVARDWTGSVKVAGRTTLLDDLRPAASHRMVLARIASDARLSPFAQVGAGEWRVDPVLFPALPTRQAYAASFGAGLDLRTNAGFQVAGEVDYTFFHREGPVAAGDVTPRLVTVLFAAQTSW
jgi:hypothetical protein